MDYQILYNMIDNVNKTCQWINTLSVFCVVTVVIYIVYKFFNWLIF